MQYDLSRKVEVVHKNRMAPAYWTPWTVYIFWLCLGLCACFACCGFVGWLSGKGRRQEGRFGERQGSVEERSPIFDDDKNRSCTTRMCG